MLRRATLHRLGYPRAIPLFGLALACWTILAVVSSGLTDAVPENRTVRSLYVGGVFVILVFGFVSVRP